MCSLQKNFYEEKEIFITETDIFKKNKPVYHTEKINIDTDELFNDGEHIIYINTSYKDHTTPLGKLLHDFLCSDPGQMMTPEMARITHYFKEIQKGAAMSEVLDDLKNVSKDIALNLLNAGQSVTFTSAMIKLYVEIVKQLAVDNNIAYTI